MRHLTLSLSLPPAPLAEIITRLFSCFGLLSTSACLNAALRTVYFKVSQVISLLCSDPPLEAACLSQSRSQKSLQSHYMVIWMLSTPASHQLLLSPGSVLYSKLILFSSWTCQTSCSCSPGLITLLPITCWAYSLYSLIFSRSLFKTLSEAFPNNNPI